MGLRVTDRGRGSSLELGYEEVSTIMGGASVHTGGVAQVVAVQQSAAAA